MHCTLSENGYDARSTNMATAHYTLVEGFCRPRDTARNTTYTIDGILLCRFRVYVHVVAKESFCGYNRIGASLSSCIIVGMLWLYIYIRAWMILYMRR